MATDSIRLFVLAAEKPTISAAGRELGMAPAVASARLAKLARALGSDLLRRSRANPERMLSRQSRLPSWAGSGRSILPCQFTQSTHSGNPCCRIESLKAEIPWRHGPAAQTAKLQLKLK